MSQRSRLIRTAASMAKCRTIDVCDIFGDNSGKALYRLDGNANDESGNYHGTETAITYGGGVYERGAVFTSSSNIAIPYNFLGLPINARAISFWIKSSDTILASPISTNAAGGGYFQFNAGSQTLDYYRVGNVVDCSATGIRDGNFHHIVLSPDINGKNTLYKDGVAVSTSTVADGINNASIILGMYRDGTERFIGSVDQVRIFNRAITATEVATLYAECAPTSTVDNINPFEDGSLKALYQFNGDATDKTGVYNGTATNVTYGTGRFGQCAVFNGTNAYVTTPAQTAYQSVAFWATMGVVGGNNLAILGGADDSLIGFNFNGNSFNMRINGGTAVSATMPTTVVANTLDFYCFVWTTATNVRLYKNAVFQSNVTVSGYQTTAITYIGRQQAGNYHNGKVDQLRFFNKALTPMEVASLCTETTPMEEPMHSLVDPFKDGSGKALYRLDGNALDESGNYNGTATSVTYGAGRFGRASYFSTSGTQYISVPYQLFNFGTADYAISCRVRFSALPVSNMFIALGGSLTTGANASGIGVRITSAGKVNLAHNNASMYTSTATLSINTDYHIVCTRISGVEYVYINNSLDGSVANTVNFNQSTGASIGGANVANINFTGYVDQSRVFSRGLTASEVTTLYNEI